MSMNGLWLSLFSSSSHLPNQLLLGPFGKMHEANGALDVLASPCDMFTQLPGDGATKAMWRDVNIAAVPRASACFICLISA
jgi:hypothetical protein